MEEGAAEGFTLAIMSDISDWGEEAAPAGGHHVRVRVEMVLEVADPDEVIRAAWARIEEDQQTPAEERARAARAVSQDTAEAVAYLIDPVDLVGDVPGVELAQASWSSERTEYHPEDAWEMDDDSDDFEVDFGDASEPDEGGKRNEEGRGGKNGYGGEDWRGA